MNIHKYSLEPYKGKSSRYTCPECNGKKQFTLYIDNETGQPLHDAVGKCNYESCYHYSPSQYFADNPSLSDKYEYKPKFKPRPEPKPEPIEFISKRLFEATLIEKAYKQNTLIIWLSRVFGEPKAYEIAHTYKLGTTKKSEAIYWQIDRDGNVRTGKIRKHNTETGKSLSMDWIHSRIEKQTGIFISYQQVYFGSHLLGLEANKGKTVAIVEGEKTALFMACIMPEYIWIATGGSSNFGLECKVNFSHIKDFTAIVFPDAGAFKKWSGKAMEAKRIGFKIAVNDLIERKFEAGECAQNSDLIDVYLPDYLARKEAPPAPTEKQIAQPKPEPKPPQIKEPDSPILSNLISKLDFVVVSDKLINPKSPNASDSSDFQGFALSDTIKNKVIDLKAYYSGLRHCPKKIVLLTPGQVITDLKKCIKTNLARLDSNTKQARVSSIDRLEAIREAIELERFTDTF